MPASVVTFATLLITMVPPILAPTIRAAPAAAVSGPIGVLLGAPGTPEAKAFLDQAEKAANAAGLSLEVVPYPAGTKARDAIQTLRDRSCVGMIGPLFDAPDDLEGAAKAAKMPLLDLRPPVEDVAAAVCGLTVEKLRVRRIALVTDPRSKESKALAKVIEKQLQFPYALVANLDLGMDGKAFEKRLAKLEAEGGAQVLIVDGETAAVKEALLGGLASRREPIVLTPRSTSPDLREVHRELYAILPRSPETLREGVQFAKDWKVTHGWFPYGTAEAADALALFAKALSISDATDATAVSKALEGIDWEGPRTRVQVNQGRVSSLLGLWRLRDGSPMPYLPSVLLSDQLEKGTQSLRDPDPELGVPFATWRTDGFQLEEDTQWVVFTFGDSEKATIDLDLGLLGLSTRGEAPLVDHLVKEELLARLLAFTSMKFLRNEDGTSKVGESLAISFATQLPEKAKSGKAWTAQVAGDDDAAGGRAWPGQGYCEIYSTFIRRTIFEEHALDPAISADDLTYLDGSYRFSTDPVKDKRSELIRALINGYAGSMALTAAHEVGHVCGLDHIDSDPAGIMNVAEGSGVDHRDGHFIPDSLEKLVKRLGVVGKKKR